MPPPLPLPPLRLPTRPKRPALPTFSDVARLPLRLAPTPLLARAVADAVNHLLRGQALRERLHELEGKCIGIEVMDAGQMAVFALRAGRLVPAGGASAHAVISGALEAFVLLASRREDPDALFFNRRLTLRGETETGVHLKNLIDALDYDWDAHFQEVLPIPLAQFASRARQRLSKI
jgi:O2-independent ubiquinone biosynthesis accessory factor UbiT